MREIAADLERWASRGEPFALATVVATRRSAPRPVGSKLAVSATGELAGSVSGGCVEADIAEVARSVLAGAPARLLTFGISDELALTAGLPCGGEIDVYVERGDSPALGALRRVAARNEWAARLVVLEGRDAGSELLVLASGEHVGRASPALAALARDAVESGRSGMVAADAARVFCDVVAPPARLLVFGAVDTAEALCRGGRALGWQTIVSDPRRRFATRRRVPSADELLVAWPEETLERVAPDRSTAVVVLTHDDRFDIPALRGALASDAFYVGALGSRRNQRRRRELLVEAGVDEWDLDRLSGPCGLDIGASSPAETAVSILAEIVARRAGRQGGPLKEARGRIHADVV